MYRALVLKELRDTSLLTAVAIALFVWISTSAMGVNVGPFTVVGREACLSPLVASTFFPMFAAVCVLFAIALGFRQTLSELGHGRLNYLLHRPMNRRAIFATKLTVGALIYMGCSLIVVLAVALWSATPGSHAGPFSWSMTLQFVQLIVVVLLLYLGAFLSGIRPGQWYGSRSLPLLAAMVLGGACTEIFRWQWGPLVLIAFLLVYIVAILFVVETRDY